MALSPAAARAPAMFNTKSASFVAAGPALPAFGKLERTGAMEALQVQTYKIGRSPEQGRHTGSGTADQAVIPFHGCHRRQLLLQRVLEALGSRGMQAAWVQLAAFIRLDGTVGRRCEGAETDSGALIGWCVV